MINNTDNWVQVNIKQVILETRDFWQANLFDLVLKKTNLPVTKQKWTLTSNKKQYNMKTQTTKAKFGHLGLKMEQALYLQPHSPYEAT